MGSILTSNNPYMIEIAILWLLSNVALLIIVYHASLKWGSLDPNSQICLFDMNSGCCDDECCEATFKSKELQSNSCDSGNRMWIFVNILFIGLLIISTLWAGELGNTDADLVLTISGILILLGGLIICALASGRQFMYNVYIIPFWASVGYLLIWFGLTFYVVVSSN